LCKWAFDTCDRNKTKHLSKEELYSGLLLVYINIARYAGPAACYPPSRDIVDTLFDACDVDNSGTICEDEFDSIMIILSSQMTSRIVTYIVFLILLLPYFVDLCIYLLCWFGLDDTMKGIDQIFNSHAPALMTKAVDLVPDSFWEQLPESMASFAIFSVVIPYCWNWVDEYLEDVAESKKESSS